MIDVLGNALCWPRRCLLTSYQMSRDVHTLTDPGQMAGVGILNHQNLLWNAVSHCLRHTLLDPFPLALPL